MKNELRPNIYILILIFFSCCMFSSGQGFKGIIPLESNCENVKHILEVEKCTVPFSVYYLKDFTVSIHFEKKFNESEESCYKVPKGTVTSVTVAYNKPLLIKDFEYELKYAEGPFGDIDTIAYENEEKGISVFTNLGRVGTAIFGPTLEQRRKFLAKCK